MILIISPVVTDHAPLRVVKIFLKLKSFKMNQAEKIQDTESEQAFDRDFRPRGAITFFILLVLLGLVIWYGIYFLMLERV